MKVCSKCGLEKDQSEFRVEKATPDRWCKNCSKEYQRKYRNSSHGKHVIQNYERKYCRSLSGKLSQSEGHRKYRNSPRGKLSIQQYTNENAKLVYERFNHKCFNCGSTNRLTIDHHYPLSLGYGLTLNNAVLLCRSCNSSKQDKMPQEFYTQEKLDILVSLLIF